LENFFRLLELGWSGLDRDRLPVELSLEPELLFEFDLLPYSPLRVPSKVIVSLLSKAHEPIPRASTV
jgi:hypothetical protein